MNSTRTLKKENIEDIQVYCFKIKKHINASDCCFESGKFNLCDLYYRLCRNLYAKSKWHDFYYPLQKEAIMFSTNELIEILLKKYDIKVDRTALRRYAKLGIIEGKKKGMGRGKGVQLYYEEDTVDKVYIIKLLLKEGKSLPEISEFNQMFIQRVVSHIAAYGLKNGLIDSNTEKYYRVMTYFLAIEAKIDFTKHNLSNMNFKFEYFYSKPEPYIRDKPLYIKIIYIDGGKIVGKATYS